MVGRYWPEAEPLGRRFKLGGDAEAPWITVVGVSRDVQNNAHSLRFTNPTVPQIFLPHAQHPRRANAVVMRTVVEPSSLGDEVWSAIWAVDPHQPVDSLLTMNQVIAQIDTQNAFFIQVLSGLSLVALLLAGVGIYGVISFAANQRRQEIGIRMALGARPRNILYLVPPNGVAHCCWVDRGARSVGGVRPADGESTGGPRREPRQRPADLRRGPWTVSSKSGEVTLPGLL